MKTRNQKHLDLAALKEEFLQTGNALMVSFQGLSVEKDGELRRALEAANRKYRVVKNTIGRLAVEGTPLESLKGEFKGMTALAYSYSDPVGLAKVLSKFAKENPKLTFKAGVVDARVINVKDIETLASMPSKEELVSKLMFVINAPAQGIAVALNGVARNLAIVLDQIAKQKAEQA